MGSWYHTALVWARRKTVELSHAYFGEITKMDKTADGDLMVYGKATGPDLDLDGDRCSPSWLKKAVPEWMKFGNVREQHSSVAAGVGKELSSENDDWFLKSLIVDPVTVNKIEKGVLKGYSIGIRNARKTVKDGKTWITDGEIVEISVVDRPCNPTATMGIAKAFGTDSHLSPIIVDEDPEPVVEDVDKKVDMNGNVDEASDISDAQDVIEQICSLIKGEIDEMSQGEDEGDGVHCLKKALEHMLNFKKSEQADAGSSDEGTATDDGDVTYAQMSADADSDGFKFVSAAQRREYAQSGIAMPNGDFPIPDEGHLTSAIGRLANYTGDKAAAKKHIMRRAKALGKPNPFASSKVKVKSKAVEGDLNKSVDVTKLVEVEVTKAVEAYEERTKALEAELAKVLATPIPGGPVLMTAPKTKVESANLSKAANYRRMADAMPDRKMANDYRELARKLELAENDK
jgi:hypothetical protein